MCMCGLWGLCLQVCGCVLHMRRLENDIECPLPFSALLSWDSNLEACWGFFFVVVYLFLAMQQALWIQHPSTSQFQST